MTSKKLTSRFIVRTSFCSWAHPPMSTLHSRHVISDPRPSLFSAALPLLCIILNANRKQKLGGGLG